MRRGLVVAICVGGWLLLDVAGPQPHVFADDTRGAFAGDTQGAVADDAPRAVAGDTRGAVADDAPRAVAGDASGAFAGNAPRAFAQRSSAEVAYAESARSRRGLLGLPAFSVRLDPFNWLIRGRLNFELEMAVWRLITVELIPTFVANSAPATFDYGGRPDPVRQGSAGLGPIAGGTLGVGLWFRGTPFIGYVLRFALSNIAVRFRSVDALGEFDHARRVERQVQMLLGTHTRLRWFTLAGDIGMGYELHHQRRCFANPGRADSAVASTGCTDDAFSIRLDRSTRTMWDLNGPVHPFYLLARFSVGAVFD